MLLAVVTCIVEATNGYFTLTSATIGRPKSSVSMSSLSGLRWDRKGSCCAHELPQLKSCAHAADDRVLKLAQKRRQQVPRPCVPREVGLAVLQTVMQRTPFCVRVKRQPDQPVHLGASTVTAMLKMLCYEGRVCADSGRV